MALEVDDSGMSVVAAFLQARAAALAARDFDALAGLFDDAPLFTATAPEPLNGCDQIQAECLNAPTVNAECGFMPPRAGCPGQAPDPCVLTKLRWASIHFHAHTLFRPNS